MPYIKNRKDFDSALEPLAAQIKDVGDLNYVITRLATRFLLAEGLNYAEINAVSGVLQKVAAEFDARVTRPYEDLKIWQNGDIPEYAEISKLIGDSYPVS